MKQRFIWKHKRPRIDRTVLKNKILAAGITIPDFRTHYRVVVIRTAWYWYRWNRKEDQWSRIETSEAMYSHLIFEKRTENNSGKMQGLFNKCYRDTWIAACRTKKQGPHLPPYTKIKSKWVQDVNLHQETIKLLEENVGSTLQNVGTGKDFLEYDQKQRKSRPK